MAAAPSSAQAIELFRRVRIDGAARPLTRLAPDALAEVPAHIVTAAIESLCQTAPSGQPDQAAQLHDSAMRAGLAMPVPIGCAMALSAAGKTARAAKLLRDWSAPGRAGIAQLLEQAQGLNRLGEHGAAIRLLNAASEDFPVKAPIARLRGLTALQLGEPGLARAALEQAVALDLSGLRRIVVELHPSLVPPARLSALMATLLNAGFETDLILDRGDIYVFDRPQPAP